MATPNLKIVIDRKGNSKIEGQEKSDVCYKISEFGKQAGKVVEDSPIDHPPVFQTIHTKGA